MEKYCEQNGCAINPSWMMATNLKSNLCEMEATLGKRYCLQSGCILKFRYAVKSVCHCSSNDFNNGEKV